MVAENLQEDEDDFNTAVAKRRIVKTGKTSGNMVEITDGLKTGETIVVEGARSVKPDQEIRIKA